MHRRNSSCLGLTHYLYRVRTIVMFFRTAHVIHAYIINTEKTEKTPELLAATDYTYIKMQVFGEIYFWQLQLASKLEKENWHELEQFWETHRYFGSPYWSKRDPGSFRIPSGNYPGFRVRRPGMLL